MSTTTINQVPSLTLRADCDRHPRPTVSRAVCPECSEVVALRKLPLLHVAHLEFHECPACSIGSLRSEWVKNLVSVKK